MSLSKGFARHILTCTQHNPAKFAPFFVDSKAVGFVTHNVATMLLETEHAFFKTADGLTLDAKLETYEARTNALAHAASALAIHYGKDLRGEMYAVVQKWGDDPLAELDRAALPWFGTPGFGVHVNGFVRKPDGLHVWIAERSMDREIDPGKLDNLIGGGMPIGLSLEENLAKEAWEEAGIDASLAKTAQPAGALHYKVEMMNGLRNDTLFIYDLELPKSFTPRNTDGEVGSFTLLPLANVAEIVRTTDRFKFNCNLVIVDFMLRHGFIGPEHPEYPALMEAIGLVRI
jgi:8-oxo-dGTP pyrophosphatase MutT (NUDIX family)